MEDELEPTQEVTEATESALAPEVVVVDVPKPKKASAVKESPSVIRAEAGDSYISLGLRYGVDPHDLVRINNNRPIREGVKVFLKEN